MSFSGLYNCANNTGSASLLVLLQETKVGEVDSAGSLSPDGCACPVCNQSLALVNSSTWQYGWPGYVPSMTTLAILDFPSKLPSLSRHACLTRAL